MFAMARVMLFFKCTRVFNYIQQENEGVCVNSVKDLFQDKGYDGSDSVLIEVGKNRLTNFAELLVRGVEFGKAKLIEIKQVLIIDKGEDIVVAVVFEVIRW